MVAFIASCFVVSRVAERARRNTMQAEQRREDVERLNALSQEMMLHGDAEGLVRDIPNLVQRIFSLESVILFVRDHNDSRGGRLYASSPSDGDMLPVLAAFPPSWEIAPELPDGFYPNNLIFGMKSVGILAWKPAALSREVDTAVSAQVAIALTRSLAIEASARLEAERASDRLRSALTDSLTHELRTPLTAIRAAATTLLDGYGLDAESRHELASIVDEASARLDTLIGQAIEMAQLDAESIRIERAPIYPHAVLEQAVEESRAQLAGRRILLDVPASDAPLWFDAHLVGRVLRHLLENAARYTPPDSVIRLTSCSTDEALEFSVEDNGPGIDERDLPHLFEKFYRGRQGTKSAKGSGMGLAIARALITAHGGSIEVTSKPGQGTVVRLRIPAPEHAPEPTG
jgi:two-component system sensor histidine kinase KdpD